MDKIEKDGLKGLKNSKNETFNDSSIWLFALLALLTSPKGSDLDQIITKERLANLEGKIDIIEKLIK